MARKFAKLTRPAIRTLGNGEQIAEHGIIARRMPSGDIRYSVNVMVDGVRIHRVIGLENDGVNRSTAERFIEAKRTEARESRLNLPAGRKTHLDLAQAGKLYIENQEAVNGANLVAKRRHFKLYLTPYFGKMRLDQITKFTVDKYKKKRLESGAAAGTVNRELTTLSHFYTVAIEEKWCKDRPKIVKLEESEGPVIALAQEECEALIKAAIGDVDPDCYLFTAFALGSGMRHREILRARFEEIDFDRCRLYIPTAKKGARTQPLTSELVDILKKERAMREDENGYIFPAKTKAAKKPHRDRLSRAFQRAVIAAGLDPDKVTPHTCRRTAATRLMESGLDPLTAMRVTGHRSVKMLDRYTQFSAPHIDRAMKALEIQKAKPRKAPKLKVVK